MPENPLDEIEQRAGQRDLGRMAANVYGGALEEAGGDRLSAFWATAAYFVAVFRAREADDE